MGNHGKSWEIILQRMGLVGADWNMVLMTFLENIGITPTDFHSFIFFRGVGQPPG